MSSKIRMIDWRGKIVFKNFGHLLYCSVPDESPALADYSRNGDSAAFVCADRAFECALDEFFVDACDGAYGCCGVDVEHECFFWFDGVNNEFVFCADDAFEECGG